MIDKSAAIASVCRAVSLGALDVATSTLKRDYPFAPKPTTKREYGPNESTRIFVRDGFLDRYTGERLIFLPALRILSTVLPVEFPYHLNWKTDATHPAYWELSPTVDHVVPVSRGGKDNESNWVTTSMVRNSAKLNWTLDELGWSLKPPGDLRVWDGLIQWFLQYVAANPEMLGTTW
jgi:5-methylcytosine-specific restriction endonuclease McrA